MNPRRTTVGRWPVLTALVLTVVLLSGCGTQTAPVATAATSTPRGRNAVPPGSPTPGTAPYRTVSTTPVPSASLPTVSPPATPVLDQPGEPHPVVYDATQDATLLADVPVARIRPGTRTSLALATPQLGLAWPRGKVTATRLAPSEVRLSYDGPGWVNAKADARTGFITALTNAGDSRQVTLRLTVTVDATAGTGTVDAWAGPTHVRFVSHEAPQTALPAAETVLAALRTQDWRALYRLSDPVLRPGTEEQFVQQLESDGAIVIRRAVVTGPATYTLGTAPATARVPIEMDATIAGRHRHQAGDLVLTYSSGSWRFSDTTS